MKMDEGDPSLFPTDSDRVGIEKRLAELLADSRLRRSSSSVTPTFDIDEFRADLSEMTFTNKSDVRSLLDWTIESLESGLVQTTHPRYFGLFNPAPTLAAELADQIAAAFNPQICVWSHAPAAVEIEQHVISQICRQAGLPDGSGGHFTVGGSEANFTAVVCALTANCPGFSSEGVRALSGRARIYVSKESHLAWLKIAHQLGIGRSAVRQIDTDGRGQIDPTALRKQIDTDRKSGDIPVLLAATAGTTNAGMVDPLHACSEIADEFGMWYHVDAAWGGALIASPELRNVIDGIELADSITIDAHKWFATTMGAGMFLTQSVTTLNEAFRVETDYMPSNDSDVDLYVNSVQWSRRFVGLRLFLSLSIGGWGAYAAHVENAVSLINELVELLESAGWNLANDSQMAVACLVPPNGFCAEQVVEQVLESGNAWISVTKFEGQSVVRACVTNGYTTTSDIRSLARQLIKLTS